MTLAHSARLLLVANTDWYLYNYRLSLARALRNEGMEAVLVSPDGRFRPALEQAGFRWIDWELGRQTLGPRNELPAIAQLARIYRREQPTLVHQHTIKPVLYGSLIAQVAGLRHVVNSITGRGYVFLGRDRKARLLRPLVRGLYRLAFRPPGYTAIFENDADRQFFIENGILPARRACLVPGVGVDPERFHTTPPPEGPPLVLLCSRMLWDKGVGVLVEAARILHRSVEARGGQLRVALVGEPDTGNPASISTDQLRAWVREGVVEWWGWRDDMPAVYAASHIVTLPSMGEGIPTTLLEGAACGRPLVTTDVSGCRDVVSDGVNGFIVPPQDPPALAAALGQLVSDPALRERMGTAGREWVLQKFSAPKIHAQTLAIYRRALEGGLASG